MAKALTTRINELKRKIAKAEDRLAKVRENEIIPPSRGVMGNEWFFREKWRKEDLAKLKAECYDLLLERIAELETENAMLSKEYEVER